MKIKRILSWLKEKTITKNRGHKWSQSDYCQCVKCGIPKDRFDILPGFATCKTLRKIKVEKERSNARFQVLWKKEKARLIAESFSEVGV